MEHTLSGFGFSKESDEEYISRLIDEFDKKGSSRPSNLPRRSQRLKEQASSKLNPSISPAPQPRDIMLSTRQCQ